MTNLPRTRAALLAMAERRAADLAIRLQEEIKENLSHPGSGRVYRKLQREHQASKPGESPAPDQGDLRRSIVARKLGEGQYRVGTHITYALALEWGGRHLAPRPFIRPAVEKVRRGR